MGGKAAADYSFPHNAALADLLEAVVLEVDILIEVEAVTRIRTAQLFVQEAQVRIELFEARIVVGDDLGEEGVEAAEGCQTSDDSSSRLAAAPATLQIFGPQTSMPGNPGQDFAAQFGVIVKSELVVGPAFTGEQFVGAALAFHAPADAFQRGEHAAGFSRRPVAHSAPGRRR